VAAPDERREVINQLMAKTQSVAGAVGRTSREIPVVILKLITKLSEQVDRSQQTF
jgi:hypothetical protein